MLSGTAASRAEVEFIEYVVDDHSPYTSDTMNADAAMNNSAATSAEPFAMGECTADASIASPTPMIAYVMGITAPAQSHAWRFDTHLPR